MKRTQLVLIFLFMSVVSHTAQQKPYIFNSAQEIEKIKTVSDEKALISLLRDQYRLALYAVGAIIFDVNQEELACYPEKERVAKQPLAEKEQIKVKGLNEKLIKAAAQEKKLIEELEDLIQELPLDQITKENFKIELQTLLNNELYHIQEKNIEKNVPNIMNSLTKLLDTYQKKISLAFKSTMSLQIKTILETIRSIALNMYEQYLLFEELNKLIKLGQEIEKELKYLIKIKYALLGIFKYDPDMIFIENLSLHKSLCWLNELLKNYKGLKETKTITSDEFMSALQTLIKFLKDVEVINRTKEWGPLLITMTEQLQQKNTALLRDIMIKNIESLEKLIKIVNIIMPYPERQDHIAVLFIISNENGQKFNLESTSSITLASDNLKKVLQLKKGIDKNNYMKIYKKIIKDLDLFSDVIIPTPKTTAMK